MDAYPYVAREWSTKFREIGTDVHDPGSQEKRFVAGEQPVNRVDKVIRDRRVLTISQLSDGFPFLVTNNLEYRKLCAQWVPKRLAADHEPRRM